MPHLRRLRRLLGGAPVLHADEETPGRTAGALSYVAYTEYLMLLYVRDRSAATIDPGACPLTA